MITVDPDQVVILAAGMGTRLGALGGGLPKALFVPRGRALIDRALEHAARFAPRDRIVVGGFRFDLLRDHLAAAGHAVTLLDNPDYRAGNLVTVQTAMPYVRASFLLMNVDHVYPPAVAIRQQHCRGDRITAFVDFDRALGADDMKVELDAAGRVARISKQLPNWDCGYVGMTYVPAGQLDCFRVAVTAVRRAHGDAACAEQVLQHLANEGESVAIGDISGIGWHELDTPEDIGRFNEATASVVTFRE